MVCKVMHNISVFEFTDLYLRCYAKSFTLVASVDLKHTTRIGVESGGGGWAFGRYGIFRRHI